jgi:2-polyprenyl-6-methoxyphenol hydroxylase-like FAD-dependent oxidoreductase
VIVVGGGPAGATTANLLAHYGIRVLLIERNLTTVDEPRAVSIDDEALRTVQAFGAVDAVLAQVVPGYGSDYYSASGRRFLQVKPTSQEHGYPKRNAFRQPVFEAQLLEHLRRTRTRRSGSAPTTAVEQDAAKCGYASRTRRNHGDDRATTLACDTRVVPSRSASGSRSNTANVG